MLGNDIQGQQERELGGIRKRRRIGRNSGGGLDWLHLSALPSVEDDICRPLIRLRNLFRRGVIVDMNPSSMRPDRRSVMTSS